MKLFKNLILALAVLFVACDPLEETYDELDANDPGLVLDFEYTISSSDYSSFSGASDADSLIADNDFFADFDQAKRLIPGILADEFSQMGTGSSAKVFFEVDKGLEEISGLVNATEFEIGSEEYEGVNESLAAAGFMSPSYDTEEVILEVLTNQIQSPGEGDIYAVEYGYASEDPIVDFASAGLKVVHEELFADDIDGYTAQNVSGDEAFRYNEFFDGNAYMSGFNGGALPNEDWIVSPMIDLAGLTDAELRFHQVINFLGSDDPAEVLLVNISTDYTDDVTTATWTQLTVDVWPGGNDWSDDIWSTMDISAFDGQQIYVGFEYNTLTKVISPAWEIGEVIVEATASVAVEVAVEPVDIIDYFQVVGGEWEMVEGVYSLNENDYDEMGEGSGQPGRFNNFSSSTDPDNYLSTFLSRAFPYAIEGDELIVTYKFFQGATVTKGDIYTFTSGTWVDEKVSLSFGFDGSLWVPDNTIKYTLSFDDYQTIGEAYATSNTAGSESMLRFTNYDVGLWDEDQRFESITSLLLDKFPGAAEGQKYLVTYDTWEPGNSTRELYVILEGGVYVLFEG